MAAACKARVGPLWTLPPVLSVRAQVICRGVIWEVELVLINYQVQAGVVLKKKGPHRRWGWLVGKAPQGKKEPAPFFLENIKKTESNP